MTIYTIDSQTVQSIAGILCTFVIAVYTFLKKSGYWDTWKDKLLVPAPIVQAVKSQENGSALAKLQMSDQLFKFLQNLAPSEDGTINEEQAIMVIRDCIKWNNRIVQISNLKDKK
jgi:hypothetical protein